MVAPPSKPLWHLRLGHLSESCMDRMRRTGATGLTFDASERLCFCESCAVCKSRVKAIPREPCADPERVFQQVGVDFCRPMTVPAPGGGRYSFLVTDFKSRMLLHDVLRTKDEAPRSFRSVRWTLCASLGTEWGMFAWTMTACCWGPSS